MINLGINVGKCSINTCLSSVAPNKLVRVSESMAKGHDATAFGHQN